MDWTELLELAMERHETKVTLLLFPLEDRTFVQRAQLLLDGLDERMTEAERLQELLRADYPNAIVRRREWLAAVDQSSDAWYVYRDGSPTLRPSIADIDPPV